MNIRLFPDGTAYVSNQTVLSTRYADNYYLLPLSIEQVNLQSLQISPQADISIEQLATVRKGLQTFDGTLKSYTDSYATLSSQGKDIIIRNYDEIQKNNLILVSMVQNSPVVISYLTQPDAIIGQVIYRLNLSTQKLEASLQISNKTLEDLRNITIDLVTSEQQPQMLYRTASFAMDEAVPTQSAAGTVYELQGTHDILRNQQVTIPLFQEDIDISIMYLFDAPRGRQNALLMLTISPPITIPGGTMYIYDDVGLITTTNIRSIGAGEIVALELDRIADVYANGVVNVSPVENNTDSEGKVPQRVLLGGTITNMLNEPIVSLVRYYIGDSNITNAANALKEGNYAQQAFEVGAKQTAKYNMSFTQL